MDYSQTQAVNTTFSSYYNSLNRKAIPCLTANVSKFPSNFGKFCENPTKLLIVKKDTFSKRMSVLKNINDQIIGLIKEEPEEDFIYVPSEKVVNNYIEIVVKSYILGTNATVQPLVVADGKGGLKFDWRESFNNEVRLYLSSTSLEKSYIYYKFGEVDDIIYSPTAEKLVQHLKNLNK